MTEFRQILQRPDTSDRSRVSGPILTGRTLHHPPAPETRRGLYRAGTNSARSITSGDDGHVTGRGRSPTFERSAMSAVGARGAATHRDRVGCRSKRGEAGSGGEGGIRTHDTLARIPVFETGTFNRSVTSPVARILPARAQDDGSMTSLPPM